MSEPWSDSWPAWGDEGKRVTILLEGKEVTGVLCYEDFCSDDDGDEWPSWLVRTPGAPDEWLTSADKWRFEVTE